MTHKDDSMKMDLTGQLLVAMPGMGDPRFDHSVIFICSHDDEGAMGLIVNKPAADLKLGDVLDRLSDVDMDDVSGLGVHVGGPVETERGFVLHSQGDSAILFDLPDARKWEAALTSIGVDPLGLSATAGRA